VCWSVIPSARQNSSTSTSSRQWAKRLSATWTLSRLGCQFPDAAHAHELHDGRRLKPSQKGPLCLSRWSGSRAVVGVFIAAPVEGVVGSSAYDGISCRRRLRVRRARQRDGRTHVNQAASRRHGVVGLYVEYVGAQWAVGSRALGSAVCSLQSAWTGQD
jgi:hypothetical protein